MTLYEIDKYDDMADKLLSDSPMGCWTPEMIKLFSSALREAAAEAYQDAVNVACFHCRTGERVELVQVQAGGPDYCHSFAYQGHSICVADELHKKAAALRGTDASK